ncbi:MAG: alpha/beta hydrolase family protein [Thalassotalea sp.]
MQIISKLYYILLSLTLTFSCQVIAQEFDIPLEAYGTIKEHSMLTISPDGGKIGYRIKKDKQDAYVVIELATNKMVTGLDISEIDPKNAYFISETQLIFVASSYRKVPGYLGKHHISSAFIYDLAEKKIRQLVIPGKGVALAQSNVGRIIGISPDKKYAYMPLYVKRGGGKPVYSLTKVSLVSKKTPYTMSLGLIDTRDYFVDRQGNLLARERYNDHTDKHSVEKYVDGNWIEIFSEIAPIRKRSFVGVTEDNQYLVMSKGHENQRAYFKFSLANGTISEPLFARKDKSVATVLSDIQRVVYGVRYSGFKPSYDFINKKYETLMTSLQQSMPNNTFRISDHTPDWEKLVLYVEGQNISGNYLLFANNKFQPLTNARPLIQGSQVHPVIETKYKAADGLTVPALVTYPKSKFETKTKLPTIMLPHGGPQSYDRYGFDWKAQYFANKGFLVIQPQFRGSSGFGGKHIRKGRGEWGKKMQTDLTDGLAHFIAKGEVDPDRVCIVGASYGGYAALTGAVLSPDLYKCVISINGVSDLEKMLKTEIDDHGDDHWVVSYWNKIIKNKSLDKNHLKNISPITHVKSVKAPVLIIAGKIDKVVPYEQSEDIYDELDDEDKDVTYVLLRDAGHHLIRNDTRLKTLQAIDKFIDKHMLN